MISAATTSRSGPAQEAIAKTPVTTTIKKAGVTGIMYRSKKSAESPLVGMTEKKTIGAATVTAQKAESRYARRTTSATTPTAASTVK